MNCKDCIYCEIVINNFMICHYHRETKRHLDSCKNFKEKDLMESDNYENKKR